MKSTQPGDILWKTRKRRWKGPSPSVVDDIVVAGGKRGIYAFNAADGTRRWRSGTTDPATNSPTVVRETVYLADEGGSVYGVNLTDGKRWWELNFGVPMHGSPAVSGDDLYIGDMNGMLRAVDTTSREMQ